MDKAIVTVLLIVVGVIAAVMVSNTVYPAIVQGGGDLVSMKARLGDRLASQIEVIQAAGLPGYTNVAQVWVKNVGSVSIKAVERCDVFFGPEGNFQRIPYGQGNPHWDCAVENDSYWSPAATLRVTVELSYALVPGERYFFKMTTPTGISDEYFFSLR